MTRSCPDSNCPGQLYPVDVMSTCGPGGQPVVLRTFECPQCRGVWLTEEVVAGRHSGRGWLRSSSASVSRGGGTRRAIGSRS